MTESSLYDAHPGRGRRISDPIRFFMAGFNPDFKAATVAARTPIHIVRR